MFFVAIIEVVPRDFDDSNLNKTMMTIPLIGVTL